MNAGREHDPAWSDALASWLLGALPASEREDFERHLAGCEHCRDEAGSLRAAVDALAVAVPPVDPPPELRDRVMSVVESEAELLRAAGPQADRPPRARRLRLAFPRPALTAAAAAAALAFGVVGGIAIVGDDDGPAPRTLEARLTDPAAAQSGSC